jgi:hypothetical protein
MGGTLGLFASSTKALISTFATDPNGDFKVAVKPGSYIVAKIATTQIGNGPVTKSPCATGSITLTATKGKTLKGGDCSGLHRLHVLGLFFTDRYGSVASSPLSASQVVTAYDA